MKPKVTTSVRIGNVTLTRTGARVRIPLAPKVSLSVRLPWKKR